MKRILVLSEPDFASFKRITLGILEKLADYEIEVLVIGEPEQEAINFISKYNVKRITLLQGDSIQSYNVEAYTNALHDFLEKNPFDFIFAGTTSISHDVFPRLSAIFGTGLAAGVNDFFFKDNQLFGIKEIYAGKCLTDVKLLGPKPWFMTIKPGVFNVSNHAELRDFQLVKINVPNCEVQSQLIEIKEHASKRPSLENADIVVAGGRGIANEKNLQALEELADILGAALGASGGAIGNGFAPKECLVGQTGTKISPLLYIACGISGAMQHLAGIRNAKRIISINSDPNAPLMRIADYAIIGDLQRIVPALTKRLIDINNNELL